MSETARKYALGEPHSSGTLWWLDTAFIFLQPAKAGDADVPTVPTSKPAKARISTAPTSKLMVFSRSRRAKVWQLFLTKLYLAVGEEDTGSRHCICEITSSAGYWLALYQLERFFRLCHRGGLPICASSVSVAQVSPTTLSGVADFRDSQRVSSTYRHEIHMFSSVISS